MRRLILLLAAVPVLASDPMPTTMEGLAYLWSRACTTLELIRLHHPDAVREQDINDGCSPIRGTVRKAMRDMGMRLP